ncbi:MAG: M48 family peptidase [Sphingomonadaceae bacterium]|nr:MAG: M48 family peptidase [Sphingomonadaceae bacterium]
MIDWLRRDPDDLSVTLGDTTLPLDIRRHPTARRMILRLADDGASARVTLPRWGRTIDAVEFAHSRRDWLAAQLDKRPPARPPRAGGTIAYRGQVVRIDWNSSHRRKPQLADETIHVGGPEETLPARLRRWLQAEVRELFIADLAFYSERVCLPAPALALSNARRRWGSCSSAGQVRLNWRLVMAPDAVRRSVAAHETAHRVHFDHSPAFHSLLDEIFEDNLAAADAWLKKNGRSLYASFG